jgi:hypothetical protein
MSHVAASCMLDVGCCGWCAVGQWLTSTIQSKESNSGSNARSESELTEKTWEIRISTTTTSIANRCLQLRQLGLKRNTKASRIDHVSDGGDVAN